jgi:hypothetical protein
MRGIHMDASLCVGARCGAGVSDVIVRPLLTGTTATSCTFAGPCGSRGGAGARQAYPTQVPTYVPCTPLLPNVSASAALKTSHAMILADVDVGRSMRGQDSEPQRARNVEYAVPAVRGAGRQRPSGGRSWQPLSWTCRSFPARAWRAPWPLPPMVRTRQRALHG